MAKKEICSSCNSNNIVMNGLTSAGKQKYRCRDCGCYRTLHTTQFYTPERREEILRSYKERASLRGTRRVYKVAVSTVLRWLEKKELVPLSSTLSPAQENDVIEYDKMWSFVQSKKNKQWLWLAVLRRNRQVVAFHFWKRDYLAFEELYDKVPLEFKKCKSTSDFWEAYDNLPKSLHIKCGKEEGETTQVESVNNVIRQRLARFVRKTCSFSKSLNNHVKVTGLFLQEYNLERLSVK